MLKRVIGVVAATAVVFSSASVILEPKTVAAATSNKSIFKKIYITSKSYIQLSDANLVTNDGGQAVSFKVLFYNGDNMALDLQDYWVRLASSGGSLYSLKLSTDDQKIKTVAPKASQTLTFYGEVGANVSWQNLVLKIVKFDFSVTGYERTVGQYSFPSGFTNSVSTASYKAIQWQNSTINARINKASISQSLTSYSVNLQLAVRNTGKFAVKVPTFEYYIRTSEGILYKLTPSNVKDGDLLQPLVLTTIKLTGSLPTSIKKSGWSLVAVQVVSDDKGTQWIPYGQFNLPIKTADTSDNSQLTQVINGSNGEYELKLSSIERLPWDQQDILAAEVQVTNKGTAAMNLPALTGQFQLNDGVTVSAKGVSNPNQIALGAGETASYIIYGTIPYTFDGTKIDLKLTESVDDQTQNDLAEFIWNEPTTSLPTIKKGQPLSISDAGRDHDIRVVKADTFENSGGKIIAVTLEQTNKNARSATLGSWTGFIKTKTGYQTVQLSKSTAAVNAGGKEQFTVWADIPSGELIDDLQLILGESLSDGKYVIKDGTPDGYANAAVFDLKDPNEIAATSDFSKISTMNYDVNIKSITANLSGTQWSFNMAATVTKNAQIDNLTNDRTWQIVIEDNASHQEVFSQNINLGKDGDAVLKEGDNYLQFKKETINPTFSDTFTLHIYEVFNGYRHELIEKSFNAYWLDSILKQ